MSTRSYFDQQTGYGLWTPRWGGNDGPDDGAGANSFDLALTMRVLWRILLRLLANIVHPFTLTCKHLPTAENGLNWTILYALGAPEEILELWRKGWEGHLKQYTEAHTIEASPEAASTGMCVHARRSCGLYTRFRSMGTFIILVCV